MATRKSHKYTALSDEQVREAYTDALRQVEHAHLQDTIQLELHKSMPKDDQEQDKDKIDLLTRRVESYEQRMEQLQTKLDALPSSD